MLLTQLPNFNLNSKFQLLCTPDEYAHCKRNHCHFFVTTMVVKTANSINAARSQRDRNRTQMSGSHRLGNFADTGDGAGCDAQRNDSRRPRNNAQFFRFLLVDIVRSWSPMTSFLPLLFDAAHVVNDARPNSITNGWKIIEWPKRQRGNLRQRRMPPEVAVDRNNLPGRFGRLIVY